MDSKTLSRSSSNKSISSINKPICRYCYEEDKISNFIYPCSCSGSLKYIHKGCLVKRLKSNINIKIVEDADKSFYLCELCGQKIQINKFYRNTVGFSMLLTAKSIITSVSNLLHLIIHILIFYYTSIKIQGLFEAFQSSAFDSSLKMKEIMTYSNELAVLGAIGYIIKGVFKYYSKLIVDEMGEEIDILCKNSCKLKKAESSETQKTYLHLNFATRIL